MVGYEWLGSLPLIKEEVNRSELVQKLANFMQFERDLRSAQTLEAFGFVVCNSVKKLVSFDSALLLVNQASDVRTTQSVTTVSGVSQFDTQAPLVKLSQLLVNSSELDIQDTELHRVNHLPEQFSEQLAQVQLQELVTVVLIPGRITLVFIRQNNWRAKELQLLQQIAEPAGHAARPLIDIHKRNKFALSRLYSKRAWWAGLVMMILLAFLPVQQSVIATGEISAKAPAIVASGLNGVIKDILVAPNESVTAGQTLVRYDDTDLSLQQNTLREELSLARERLRKARQQNLTNGRTDQNNRFADLQTQVELKTIELAFIEKMMSRLEIKAASNGVALFSRAEDWVGRSVVTGEKIMEIADSSDQQFEIWVAASDAIDLPVGSLVKFFPDAFPLRSLKGSIESTSFYATQITPETLAYRVLAKLEKQDERVRLGMKGTFRLYGDRVSLGYYLFRKPLSAIRRSVGI